MAYLLLSLLAAAIAFGFFYVSLSSQANEQVQDVDVGNASPMVDSIYIALDDQHEFLPANQLTSIAPIDGSFQTVYVYGEATDYNGCDDLWGAESNWEVKVYRSGVAGGEACMPDNNDCYVVDTASNFKFAGCDGAGDLTMNYQASFDLAYWADGTSFGDYSGENWVVKVVSADPVGVGGSSFGNFEMDGTAGASFTQNLSYGTVDLGMVSDVQIVTMDQTGNVPVNLQQTSFMDSMICSGEGEIPFSNVKMSLSPDFDYETEGTPFVGAGGEAMLTGIDLPLRTDESATVSKDIYLKVKMPELGLRGNCSGVVTFTSIPIDSVPQDKVKVKEVKVKEENVKEEKVKEESVTEEVAVEEAPAEGVSAEESE